MLYISPGCAGPQHQVDRRAVVLHEKPVPLVEAVAIKRDVLAVEQVRYEQRHHFSGYCQGPKLLDERVTMTGKPYVV